ncbi:MAG: dihydrodipicolinate synthase family protein [Gemmatimonadales bacterium]|jgi:4-hydroxy-2-oxoglutarate aldolase
MTLKLEGLFAPVITTFHRDSGDVDVASFAANVRAHLAAGAHGIVVTGSTGEAALLTADERAALVAATREAVPDDKSLIVGTGAESTRACLALTREAAVRGADAVLVVAPHYYGPSMTSQALITHYRRVADESKVPVLLYNIPKYMHFSIPAGAVAELAAHPNIVGMKDSSGNKELFASYLASQSPKFSVLTGNAGIFQHALAGGATGGILAVSLFATALSLDVLDSMRSGAIGAAIAAQERLSPLNAKIVAELGVAGIKAAMDRVGRGVTGGPVRPPLLPLDAEQSRQVEALLESAELAPAA